MAWSIAHPVVPDSAKLWEDSMRLLVVSDLHLAFTRITDLADWMYEHEEVVDMIIVLGDSADLSTDDRKSPEKLLAAEGDVTTLMSALENIMCHVVYIPGNHDPDSLMALNQPLPRLTPNSCNLHGQSLRIASDLVLAGFGGSIDGKCNGETFWKGHPYDETTMDRELRAVLEGGAKDGEIKPTDSILLLTHTGPWGASTTIDHIQGPLKSTPTTSAADNNSSSSSSSSSNNKPALPSPSSGPYGVSPSKAFRFGRAASSSGLCSSSSGGGSSTSGGSGGGSSTSGGGSGGESGGGYLGSKEKTENTRGGGGGEGGERHPILCGSTALLGVLQEPQQQAQVVLNMHGHVHNAPGQDKVGSVPILNPGSLSEGRFSLVQLRRGGGRGGDPEHQDGGDGGSQERQQAAAAWRVAGVQLHELPELLKLGRKPYRRSGIR